MELFFLTSITFGLLVVLLLLFIKIYSDYKKKLAGFPFVNILPYLLYCHVTGKISKDTPFNQVIFEKIVQTGKQYIEEGLFMMFWSRPVLFICSEEPIKFFANEKAATDKSHEYRLVQDIMGLGLATSNGERWRTHRRLINPAFNMVALKEKIPLFNEHAMALVKDMEKLVGKPSVDILDHLKCHYFNSLCESVLGLKREEESREESMRILKHIDDLTAMMVQRFMYPWLRPKFILNLLPSGRKFYQQQKELRHFINEIISDMKKIISTNKNNDGEQFGSHLSKSFTYILLNYHLNNPTFTLEDLHDEVTTIIATGYDTTVYSTLWCLFLLGLHPEIQEKVFSEIQSTASDYITPEECSNLTYLEAVILESLRLYPTVPMYLRNLSEDVQYGKHKIFKGTTISFFAYLSHRNPKLYPEPEKFKPERFLNEKSKKPGSFIPFSEGSRSCIGKHYALMDMKIFLAHILRNFKITSLDKKEDVKICWAIVISPSKPLRMKIMPRDASVKHEK